MTAARTGDGPSRNIRGVARPGRIAPGAHGMARE